ncbi:ATP-binding protein [bacterium]|nr:ATP-binding protein [bacterium]
MINRALYEIVKSNLFKGKVILLLGARQVGKTTLLKLITKNRQKELLWLNGDEPDIRNLLTNTTSTQLKTIIGNKTLIVIDEAQRITNIGLTLKLIVDNFSHVQLLVTGSSSLELANHLKEPLTGRKYEYNIYPISFSEMVEKHGFLEERRLLEHRMIFGCYPEVVTSPGEERKLLNLLSDSYLYRDLFALEGIKKPPLLEKILQALALQLGNEVSYNEIAQLVGSNPTTVEKYIDLLEKSFVVFKLPSLSRNLRNEIKKGKKIYFYDNGIRNSIINNYNLLNVRNDVGALWENFLMSERQKRNHYNENSVNAFFWRTHAGQEIDYIEEYDGFLHAYEFKWNPKKKAKIPKSFLTAYPDSEVKKISTDNFEEFVLMH